nr:MAG TPA: hypothetical protein [Caudoviricetes sp.]
MHKSSADILCNETVKCHVILRQDKLSQIICRGEQCSPMLRTCTNSEL